MFTDKAEREIKRWLPSNLGIDLDGGNELDYWVYFQTLPEAMQIGVIELFSDSMGYKIEIFNDTPNPKKPFWTVLINDVQAYKGYKETRPKAWDAARKKLNDLINE